MALVRRICDKRNIKQELKHLEYAFGVHVYTTEDINKCLQLLTKNNKNKYSNKIGANTSTMPRLTDMIGKIQKQFDMISL